MLIAAIILFILSVLILIYCGHLKKNVHQYNSEIDNKNQELQKEYDNLKERIGVANQTKAKIEASVKQEEDKLDWLQNNFNKNLNYQKELSQNAFENYCDLLDTEYKNKEKEYETLCKRLEVAYSQQQEKLMREAEQCRSELESIKSTRDAALAAILKEQEIKEKLSFYCLNATANELDDIKLLERIKKDLHNPRILSMLIWSTYFQKPMTTLCNNILGTETICGIYKITNQTNGLCYIGQSVDIATRWKNHAKAGLGIDTPAGNKLYKAMQDIGIWNFSWELLEQCPREELNIKEKYYIELYKSYEFGYNSNTGIGK